jgi:hypothetical protein
MAGQTAVATMSPQRGRVVLKESRGVCSLLPLMRAGCQEAPGRSGLPVVPGLESGGRARRALGRQRTGSHQPPVARGRRARWPAPRSRLQHLPAGFVPVDHQSQRCHRSARLKLGEKPGESTCLAGGNGGTSCSRGCAAAVCTRPQIRLLVLLTESDSRGAVAVFGHDGGARSWWHVRCAADPRVSRLCHDAASKHLPNSSQWP